MARGKYAKPRTGRLKHKWEHMEGKSLNLFAENHPLREAAFRLVYHRAFEYAILAIIFANTFTLAYEPRDAADQSTGFIVFERVALCMFTYVAALAPERRLLRPGPALRPERGSKLPLPWHRGSALGPQAGDVAKDSCLGLRPRAPHLPAQPLEQAGLLCGLLRLPGPHSRPAYQLGRPTDRARAASAPRLRVLRRHAGSLRVLLLSVPPTPPHSPSARRRERR